MKASNKKILMAARSRAAGQSWKATAEAVGVSINTVRTWPDRYPAEWKRCFEQAQQETQDEAEAEAVATLRTQLRDEETSAGATAAKAILTWLKRPMKPTRDLDMSDEELSRRHIESLTAGQAEDLAEELKALNQTNEPDAERDS